LLENDVGESIVAAPGMLHEDAKVNRLVCFALLRTATPPLQSQSVQDYDAHLSKLQKSVPTWKAQVDAVDLTRANVSYNLGKILDDDKKALKENIGLIAFYSAVIPAKRQLSAQINLYAALRDAYENVNDLGGTLASGSGPGKTIELTWANQLANTIQGPLNDEIQFQIQAFWTFADDTERRCGAIVSKRVTDGTLPMHAR
jgi:hypothetical protein